MSQIDSYVIQPTASLREVMACIDKNSKGIMFVVDPDLRLLGSISDGDLRRAILSGVKLDLSIQVLLDERKKTAGHGPITARAEDSDADLLHLMNQYEIRQIPIVDSEGRILRLAFLGDLVREYELPINAVVMAGGFGTRLRPLTDNTPKPMLRIGDRPMLEWTIEQLKKTGIQHISLTTHYMSEAISEHFGNGDDFGVKINYLHEETPLGTAGALGLLGKVDGPLLVINGDILTQVDFRAMLNYHQKHKACLTVGVRRYDLQVPYGVVECSGARVCKVSEKPQMPFLVNAGIYLIEPAALQFIPRGRKFDMPDLIQRLITENLMVVSFPILEYWLDIGRPGDYETAQEDVRMGRIS